MFLVTMKARVKDSGKNNGYILLLKNTPGISTGHRAEKPPCFRPPVGSTLIHQPATMSVSIGQRPNPSQPKPTASLSAGGHLTSREAEILVLLAGGKLPKEVALRLNISAETVKKHLRNVYQKTGAQNKIEALNKTRSLLTAFTAAQR